MDQAKRVENIFTDVIAVPARVFKEEAKRIGSLRQLVLASGDPEAVHDLRVAIRKVRTAIRLFWPVFSQDARLLDAPLRELFHKLGEVRALDVAISTGCQLSTEVRVEVLERLSELRTIERDKLNETLARPGVLDYLTAMTTPFSLTPPSGVNSGKAHPIRIAHRKAIKSLRRVSKLWDGTEVHRMRRRVKRLRYVVEFYRTEYGAEAKAYANELTDLQDALGKVVDQRSLGAIFRNLDGLSRLAAKECRGLASEMDKEADENRDVLRTSEKHLSGRSWKRLANRALAPKKSLAM